MRLVGTFWNTLKFLALVCKMQISHAQKTPLHYTIKNIKMEQGSCIVLRITMPCFPLCLCPYIQMTIACQECRSSAHPITCQAAGEYIQLDVQMPSWLGCLKLMEREQTHMPLPPLWLAPSLPGHHTENNELPVFQLLPLQRLLLMVLWFSYSLGCQTSPQEEQVSDENSVPALYGTVSPDTSK